MIKHLMFDHGLTPPMDHRAPLRHRPPSPTGLFFFARGEKKCRGAVQASFFASGEKSRGGVELCVCYMIEIGVIQS